MRIFYIGKVAEETCDLYTRTKGYERTVALEELNAIATENIIIGYNKLTGKISVETGESVLNYINSKLKLSGRENLDLADVVGEYEVINNEDGNTVKVRIYAKDVCGCDSSDIIDELSLYAKDLANALENYDDYDVELIYDLSSFKRIWFFDIDTRGEIIRTKCNLAKITITNKDMFKHTEKIFSLFRLPFKKIKKDFIYDLSAISFNPNLVTSYMFEHIESTEPVRIEVNETFFKATHNMLITKSSIENKDFIYLIDNCKNVEGKLFDKLYLNSLRFSEYERVLKFSDDIAEIDYFYLDKPVSMTKCNKYHNILVNNVVLTPEFEMQLSEKDMNSIKVVGHYLLSDFALTTKISMHNIDVRFHIMLDEVRKTYCHTLRTKIIPNRTLKCRTDEEKDLVINTIMDFTNFSSEEYNNISDTFSFMRFRKETNIYSDFPLEYVEAVCFMLTSKYNGFKIDGYSFMSKGLKDLK